MQTLLTVSEIREEVPGVKTFVLEAGNPLAYKAGQFLTMLFTHHGRGERRSFSLSGSPSLNEPLQITIKRVVNGAYSRYMTDRVREGDSFLTTGAAGLFTLPEKTNDCRQIFFFAAGIGITPVFSLIKEALLTLPAMHLVLVYSNRHEEDIVFRKELMALGQQYADRFKIEWLLSGSFDLSHARLSKSLIRQLLHEHSLVPKERQLFYTCGPYEYMRMVIYGLEELNINESQIKKENFDVSIPVLRQEPPDRSPHRVFIKLPVGAQELRVQYPETILQAAQKERLELPYSCNAGRCGSCVAKCTGGKVWMSVNEVLTDADIAKGLVLTCTGYPVEGDVWLEI
jgi:ferredoxin-NADP reductase